MSCVKYEILLIGSRSYSPVIRHAPLTKGLALLSLKGKIQMSPTRDSEYIKTGDQRNL
jgi:hypothetical protein